MPALDLSKNKNEKAPQETPNTSTSKRASRTELTDEQKKVLKTFFQKRRYLENFDLGYLSNLLNLSSKVIEGWFKNQRAKQVANTQLAGKADMHTFKKTPHSNNQCKECLYVFEDSDQLIHHQKTSCTVQAQAAAVQNANSKTTIEQSAQEPTHIENSLHDPMQPNFSTEPAPTTQNFFR